MAGTMADPREAEILEIVAKETGVERARLVPEAAIADLDIPSLDLVQTIFALETRYNIEIPVASERSGAEFTTVGDLVGHVLRTIQESEGAAGDGMSRAT